MAHWSPTLQNNAAASPRQDGSRAPRNRTCVGWLHQRRAHHGGSSLLPVHDLEIIPAPLHDDWKGGRKAGAVPSGKYAGDQAQRAPCFMFCT